LLVKVDQHRVDSFLFFTASISSRMADRAINKGYLLGSI
jgi:hypothetical protein